jgi:histidyl-tRNA synthetase
MDKTKLQTLKGFRDFLPEMAKKRQFVQDIIKNTFELYGFSPLETPALEYKEVLLGKYGDEADKLVYTFQDKGGREVAMRYDQTVPTARVLAMYNQELPMPWRRYQIQTVWRAENPQRGRFRELLQCDADIYGANSPVADAEIIALSNHLYKSLGFEKISIFINDRKILFNILELSSIPEPLQLSVIQSIDKLDRKSKEEVKEELMQKGLEQKSIDHLYQHLDLAKPTDELLEIIKYAVELGVPEENIIFLPGLARGLDYYTGTIFEIKIKGYDAGSVLGGGRYDKLIGSLSGTDIPAVGFAVGFDRTIEAMELSDLFKLQSIDPSVLVTVFDQQLMGNSLNIAGKLRSENINTEVYPDTTAKLEKQLKYADKKGIKWLIVIGPEEVKKNTVILKDLQTGHQVDINTQDLINKIKES